MKKIAIFLLLFNLLIPAFAYAQGGTATQGAGMHESAIAKSPADCGSRAISKSNTDPNPYWGQPVNCLFLEEPIGGKANYDLYIITCKTDKDATTQKKIEECTYNLWNGGSVPANAHGPVQAVLTFSPDKPYEGPFGLLYNYLGLVYAYMSGLIVGVGVLFVVIGGIQMSTSAGDTAKFDAGKSRIVKAIVGIILWFTASLLLYTINPTFFAF